LATASEVIELLMVAKKSALPLYLLERALRALSANADPRHARERRTLKCGIQEGARLCWGRPKSVALRRFVYFNLVSYLEPEQSLTLKHRSPLRRGAFCVYPALGRFSTIPVARHTHTIHEFGARV
jgi:hypothetical protein